MATYDDFDGCYFTVQALNMYHDMRDTEIVVVDNFGCDYTRDFLNNWVGNSKYIRYSGAVGTSAPRDLVFHEASGEVVVCMDCHVMFMPGAIAKLKRYYNTHPDCMDLIQGPMMNDNLAGINTHFDPVGRERGGGLRR
jgi:glycosyltransferase involved in cell wall biosynthesis